jgi:16S rRNA (cytidine1402-2'-O)-methyltransferase
MTKLYEEVIRTTLSEAAQHFDRVEPRGEFVIVVAGGSDARSTPSDDDLVQALRQAVDGGLSKRDAVAEVTKATGQPRRRVYELSTVL